jgi:hypothetical protein
MGILCDITDVNGTGIDLTGVYWSVEYDSIGDNGVNCVNFNVVGHKTRADKLAGKKSIVRGYGCLEGDDYRLVELKNGETKTLFKDIKLAYMYESIHSNPTAGTIQLNGVQATLDLSTGTPVVE